MPTPLNEPILRALVGDALRDEDAPRILGISAPPQWPGERTIQAEGRRVLVEPCVSPLAIRDVVAGRTLDADEILVILTDRTEEEIGQEILARLWRHRLQRPSRWEAAKNLFRVDQLDPALADHKWLVGLLVEVAPPRGYPPPPGGLLDFETAWRTLLRHGLGITVPQPSAADLLRWGATERARTALQGPVGQHRAPIAALLEPTAGPVAGHCLRLVSEGRGHDLVPLGLICEALWAPAVFSELPAQNARIRLETPLGAKNVATATARSWAEAATQVFRDHANRQDTEHTEAWAARAEVLLKELDAVELAMHSSILSLGFVQRLINVGHALGQVVQDPTQGSLDVLDQAIGLIESHVRAAHDEDRVRKIHMAARAARRLVHAPTVSPTDLAGLSKQFTTDGAWVDAVREALSHGETVSALTGAYSQLLAALDTERHARDLTFGRAFAKWSEVLPTSSTPLIPIERVLGEIVGPLATQAPVLFLVLDGFSFPESIRLSADIRAAGWIPVRPDEHELPTVVAAIPTVTVVCRASLLSGKLVEGGQDVERTGFEEHPALRSTGTKPPRLFHKKDLKIDAGRMAPEVHEAILDTQRTVVGVVVNAVDDHLDKGAQLRLADGLPGIRPLRPLLDAAAEAGRVVVLASDHGHVLESGSQVRPAPGGGERWRLADPAPKPDEVVIAGPRVLRGGGRIVAAATDKVRYIPTEKRGYHGGATPEEVLCPLLVMTTANVTLSGWTRLPAREPEWWSKAPATGADLETPSYQAPIVDANGQGILFPETPLSPARSAAPAWLDPLLQSPVMVNQRASAGRQALDDDSVRGFLEALATKGGVAPPAFLSDTLSLPPSRLRTKLEALRRLLNVDGYPVMTIEADGTTRLNIELLRTQFEVEE